MHSEESIFVEASQLPLADREAFLDRVCESTEQRQRIERLLAAHENTDSFLDQSPMASPLNSTTNAESAVGHRIGHYHLLQQIGEGGFGVVYMSEQREPVARKVALKIIKPGMDSQLVVARFEAERQALAIMDHPNIARVLDAGTTPADSAGVGGGRPYFVMELVRGAPITEYCDKNALTMQQRLKLFVEVCKAVQHAHLKGIIHRDIKPSNVMVTLHDGEPVVKVIDFGVAKALNQRLTERTLFTEYGQMIGTPQYMSPEQAEMSGLDVDTRSDIYSLAVLLYELLTGSTPLEAQTLRRAGYAEMQRMICEQSPPMPSQRVSSHGQELTMVAEHRSASPERLHRELKGDLDWIVMKGLEKDRRRRYESALSFAQDVQRAMENRPVQAGPPTWSYRLGKFVHRHSRAVITGGLATALVVAILALFAIQSWNRRQQRLRVDGQLSQALETASWELGQALNSDAAEDWEQALSSQRRIQDILATHSPTPALEQRTKDLLARFEAVEQRRAFQRDVEALLIARATSMDKSSWTAMEAGFRDIFRKRGLDLDKLPPMEVAQRIRQDPDQVQLADALELWLGTRGQLAAFGGPAATRSNMQPWADAIYVADPDPLRTGIRRVIYQADPATKEHLESLVSRVDLEGVAPRTLSWLAITFLMAGDAQRSNELHRYALRKHPGDLMLNFDMALALENQGDDERAIRYYMRCTALRPRLAGIWTALGNALQRNGEPQRAVEAMERAVALAPEHAPAWEELGKLQFAQQDYDQAVISCRRATELDDQLKDAWRYWGRAELELKHYREAHAALLRCQQLTSRDDEQLQQWIDDCRLQLAPTP